MKKLILLVLVAAIAGAACKKEKKSNARADKPIAEAIRGTWYTTAETHEYYNANNEKVFTRTVEPGWKFTLDDNIRIWSPQGVRHLLTQYTISNLNGKNYLNYTQKSVEKNFEILSLEEEIMSWRLETANVQYEDNGPKTAAKEVTVMDFHCPCK
ncbi:hypothetical protein GZH53_12410 [Flavihumibacter sp. R14]|nr:hypothetical protein [Flavihumibacter soli]